MTIICKETFFAALAQRERMKTMPNDGLSKLAALMGEPDAPPSKEQLEGEEDLNRDVAKVMEFVAKIAGDNLFDQQILVEACASSLIDQIREELSE